MRIAIAGLLTGTLLSFAAESQAAITFSAQGRVFAGATAADPTDLNTQLSGQGIKPMSAISHYGAEVAYPLLNVFEVGLRYSKKLLKQEESSSSLATDYYAQLDQDSLQLVGRIPVLKTSILRLDGFGGIGGSNTTLKLKSAGVEGEWSRKDNSGWVAAPISSYGGSLAIGWKPFYVVIEAGVESNKIKGLVKSGSVSTLDAIDLSGSFVNVGILINGAAVNSK